MKYILLFYVCFLVACTATPYQSGIGTGQGYFETRISENKYTVSFQGNSVTTYQQAYDYALLRATEIGLELGYELIVLEGAEKYSEQSTGSFAIPVYTPPADLINGSGTWSTGQQTYTEVRPGYKITVVYLNEEPEGLFLSDTVFNIQDISKNLKLKYFAPVKDLNIQ